MKGVSKNSNKFSKSPTLALPKGEGTIGNWVFRDDMNTRLKKIVLFGPESTGKTVLAQALAAHYHTLWVPEFARSYLENKIRFYDLLGKSSEEICLESDIPPIVMGQIASEDSMSTQAKKLIFFDTNPLQTSVYVSYYYQKQYDWLTSLLKLRTYDHYLLMDTDIAWEADPLRDRPNNRQEIFELFKNELINRNLPFTVISGNAQHRINHAIMAIDMLDNNK